MVEVYQVNAFTKEDQGGNPAGVVLDASGLGDSAMQSIAQAVGFSETAFVTRVKQSCRVRFFTRTGVEVGLCGHAAIAAYSALWEKNRLRNLSSTMDTTDERIHMSYENELVTMRQEVKKGMYRIKDTVPISDVASCLGLEIPDLGLYVPIIATGAANKLFVPVASLDLLGKIQVDDERIERVLAEYDAKGMYLYSMQTIHEESTAHCVNIAPSLGTSYEPATGTSAAALAYLLFQQEVVGAHETLQFEQGYITDQPSEIMIRLDAEEGVVKEINTAGRAITIGVKGEYHG